MNNEKVRFSILLFGTCCVLLLAVFGASFVLGLIGFEKGVDGEFGKKEFRRTLVEGLQVSKQGFYGVDFVKCASCRLEKRRAGPITFGGLNVLAIDDLQVVLPPKRDIEHNVHGDVRQGYSELRSIVRRLGVSESFLSRQGVPLRFSGLHIKTLCVNRLSDDSKKIETVFAADSAEAVRGGLSLSGCTVFRSPDKGELVGKAMLSKAGGGLLLAWRGGEMSL